MFNIITNLELMFNSLEEAWKYAVSRPEFQPKIPYTAMLGEDRVTPRICVAPTIEDCVSAIKPWGVFRRCLNANEDAKSYENDDEVYPILIAEFDDSLPWVKPSKQQVSDVEVTNEHWLLSAARPNVIRLKWLDAYSIGTRDDRASGEVVCTSVRFVEDLTGRNHPWLNGKGHPLDCSDMGSEPWPKMELAIQELWYDLHLGGQLCFAMPLYPFDGRCWVYPLNKEIAPYRSYIDRMRRVAGFYDQTGTPVLDWYLVSYHGVVGEIRFLDGLAWVFIPDSGGEPRVIRSEDIGPKRVVQDLVVLTPENISIPEGLAPNSGASRTNAFR